MALIVVDALVGVTKSRKLLELISVLKLAKVDADSNPYSII